MENKKLSNSRRKIVLASVSTPIVATLNSGAAMAASSANVCNSAGNVSKKKFPDNGNSVNGDTAVRVQVPTFIKNNGVSGSKYVYKIEGSYYKQNSNEISYNYLMSNYTRAPKDAFVLLLFGTDSQGTYEIGLWPKYQITNNGNGQFPINASCLTSVAVSGSKYI